MRRVPIHERSVHVGDVIVVNGYRANRTSLTARFAEGGYQLHRVLGSLLAVTKHRLICAVPFESGEPSQAYDHNLLTRAKLAAVSAWCIRQIQGAARLWYKVLPRETGLLLMKREA